MVDERLADLLYILDESPDAAYSVNMSRSFSILLAAAILLQTLLGGFAAAGTICLGGGHEHPQEAATSSCAIDCSHAAFTGVMPAAVEGAHGDCGCVDIELDFDDFLSVLPRSDSTLTPAEMPALVETLLYSDRDLATNHLIQSYPKWFEPGRAQRAACLSSTRLIV